MKLLQPVSEETMVAAFLRAELGSLRLSDELRQVLGSLSICETVILNPDLSNERENDLRRQALADFRGYGRNCKIFTAFPVNLRWYKAELDISEVPHLLYVDYPEWHLLTGGSRRVKDAITRIAGRTLPSAVVRHSIVAAAKEIEWQPTYDREPLIVWGTNPVSPLTILEGHHRSTSLAWCAMNQLMVPATVKALIGLSEPVLASELWESEEVLPPTEMALLA